MFKTHFVKPMSRDYNNSHCAHTARRELVIAKLQCVADTLLQHVVFITSHHNMRDYTASLRYNSKRSLCRGYRISFVKNLRKFRYRRKSVRSFVHHYFFGIFLTFSTRTNVCIYACERDTRDIQFYFTST